MVKEGDNSFGVASVILGILSIVSFFVPPISLTLAITGFVFGLIQRKRSNNKWALLGIILNIIAIVLALLVIFWVFKVITSPDFQKALTEIQQAQQAGQSINSGIPANYAP